MLGKPSLVCLDDPTSELDEDTARLAWGEVARARLRGTIVVVVLPDDGYGPELDHILRTGAYGE